ISQIVDSFGPRDGHGLRFPVGLAADTLGNVYVTGNNTANVLKVDPEGEVTIVALPSRDGLALSACSDIVTAPDGTVYFARVGKDALWRLTPEGRLDQLLDESGAGPGERLRSARGLALAPDGHVYISGFASDNVFRVVPPPLDPASGG
ncbi:MAG: SBBP repeat-containing protein, partial [Myxococcota bacterium]|nr:SBBP repeat-containing protein [Myxococcota bacterium]